MSLYVGYQNQFDVAAGNDRLTQCGMPVWQTHVSEVSATIIVERTDEPLHCWVQLFVIGTSQRQDRGFIGFSTDTPTLVIPPAIHNWPGRPEGSTEAHDVTPGYKEPELSDRFDGLLCHDRNHPVRSG
ncbi:hypothetical protein D3C71_608310 [compost metagenome]